MSAKQVFLLAIDHRRSFERLFGVDGDVDAATHRRLEDAKVVVHDALCEARSQRPDLGGIGILIDDHYGGPALAAARDSGVATAVAVERSGMDVLEFEHDDWKDRLATQPPTYAKVLVRHRADGDAAANDVQLARLRELSDVCRQSTAELLIEVLTPYTDDERAANSAEQLENELRPRLIVDAMVQMQDAGIEADVWKIEGISDAERCSDVAAQARTGGRDHVGVVVLGAGAGNDTVAAWLSAAARGGYSGFAVGRSIWAEPLTALAAGGIDQAGAQQRIAEQYLHFVDAFLTAT